MYDLIRIKYIELKYIELKKIENIAGQKKVQSRKEERFPRDFVSLVYRESRCSLNIKEKDNAIMRWDSRRAPLDSAPFFALSKLKRRWSYELRTNDTIR